MSITVKEFIQSIDNPCDDKAMVEVFYSKASSFSLVRPSPQDLLFRVGVGTGNDFIVERYANAIVKQFYVCDNRIIRVWIDSFYVTPENSIDALEMPSRLRNPLFRGGFIEISQITSMTVTEFVDRVTKKPYINDLGEKSAYDIIEAVHKKGYHFKDEKP